MSRFGFVAILLASASAYVQAAPPPASAQKTKPAAAATTADSKKPVVKTNDRLDLESTTVTGNRELPKVLYIVPWKKADLGDLPGQPFNTLLDEALTPVDRDVFRREVDYYQVIAKPEAAKPGDGK